MVQSLPIGKDLDIEKSKFLYPGPTSEFPPRVSKRSQSIWSEGLGVKPFGKFFTSGAVARQVRVAYKIRTVKSDPSR